MTDWTHKKVSMGFTTTETPRTTVRVWRWKVGKLRVVSSAGLFGWLRPLVELPSLADMILASSAEVQKSIGLHNALYGVISSEIGK